MTMDRKGWIGAPPRAGVAATTLIPFRVTREEHDRYTRAAAERGVTLSQLIRTLLDRASKPRTARRRAKKGK